MANTKDKFGVPITGATGSGILMPKLKYRFRVAFLAPFGGANEAKVLTQNVQSATRPSITYEEVQIDSYNSKAYIQGKHTWETVQIVLRDDITNSVTKLVAGQLQRQVNHFDQVTTAAANDFKFDMKIEILDGVNEGASEVWDLEGCFLTNVNYSDSDYSANDPVQITLTVRFDNALHVAGSNSIDGRTVGGALMDTPAQLGNTTGA